MTKIIFFILFCWWILCFLVDRLWDKLFIPKDRVLPISKKDINQAHKQDLMELEDLEESEETDEREIDDKD